MIAPAKVWLVWSNEHAAWWGRNRSGYTLDVANAGRYTLAEARAICEDARAPNVNEYGNPTEIATPAPEFPTLPYRGDVGAPEATRDPIFLLQFRDIRLGAEFPHTWNSDTERVETDALSGKSGYSIREYAAAFPDNVVESWRTESVWFTRVEAEEWMQTHAYRHPDGMRVYCLCAEGALAGLLQSVTAAPR